MITGFIFNRFNFDFLLNLNEIDGVLHSLRLGATVHQKKIQHALAPNETSIFFYLGCYNFLEFYK